MRLDGLKAGLFSIRRTVSGVNPWVSAAEAKLGSPVPPEA